jgi:hypothetical protein
MSGDLYLQGILYREAVDTSLFSPVRQVQARLNPMLRGWGGTQLLSVSPSGSFMKGTANKSGTDIDLFLSLAQDTTQTLKEIYEGLFATVRDAGYTPTRQNVSINIRVGGYDVDLVPAKRQDSYSQDHSLFRRRADTWTKTNIQTHIATVVGSGRQAEIRALKLWRSQKGIDFPSFYLEMLAIEALKGKASRGLAGNVLAVLEYFRDRILSARVVDPSNTNNIVSDELSQVGKAAIKAGAERALQASDWNQIVI